MGAEVSVEAVCDSDKLPTPVKELRIAEGKVKRNVFLFSMGRIFLIKNEDFFAVCDVGCS